MARPASAGHGAVRGGDGVSRAPARPRDRSLAEGAAAAAVRADARAVTGHRRDYDPLVSLIGDARVVLIGEASHGTHEFYRERARITKRLIAEHGFSAVAIEARLARRATASTATSGAMPHDASAEEALRGFRRFPTWMWRNADVLDFVGWLRAHNDAVPADAAKVGFYGLDLYSLGASMEAVVGYLDERDPEAAARAREALRVLRADSGDERLLRRGGASRRQRLVPAAGPRRSWSSCAGGPPTTCAGTACVAEDEYFFAEQNAARRRQRRGVLPHDVRRAGGLVEPARPPHGGHARSAGGAPRPAPSGQPNVVVWEHNSHVGDARATEMARRGELNLGQLHARAPRRRGRARRFHHLLGHRHRGLGLGRARRAQARAAGAAGELRGRSSTPPTSRPSCCARSRRAARVAPCASRVWSGRSASSTGPRPSARATGFTAAVVEQFDALVHVDVTRAVEPLERSQTWELGEPPETYPTAL